MDMVCVSTPATFLKHPGQRIRWGGPRHHGASDAKGNGDFVCGMATFLCFVSGEGPPSGRFLPSFSRVPLCGG